MILEMEKVRAEKYYSVGYFPKLEKYVLAAVVTWAAWYNRYYEISEKEYNLFGTEVLDNLAEQLCWLENRSERFLFSDKNEENNNEQLKLRDMVKCD